MKFSYSEPIRNRLQQLAQEIQQAGYFTYYDRLRALMNYCESTPALASCLAQLPTVARYDFQVRFHDLMDEFPDGDASYAYRWDAIRQIVESGLTAGARAASNIAWKQFSSKSEEGLPRFTKSIVLPLCDYLLSQLEASSTVLYLLLRYKRWAEWFEAERLRSLYKTKSEEGLDMDLRRFLFESGMDYPLSQPRSPGGQADIVAELDTEDPLVLEVKVWDSRKTYKENRVRDGLRQAMDYATKYGKDKGYVVVFNLDREPLVFVGEPKTDEWPPSIELDGRTYCFIAIDLAEQAESVSQRDKGKRVSTNEVRLAELRANLKESE